MIDYRFVKLIERIRYTNERGERICGTAALLHFLRCPIKSLNARQVALGKAYVQKYLSE